MQKAAPLAAWQLQLHVQTQHGFINFCTVALLAMIDHPCPLAAAPTVPGVVTLIILLSTPHSTSQ